MFDLRPQASSDLHGHPHGALSQPAHITASATLEWDDDIARDPLVMETSGCDLLDGIRNGLARHGWTLPALAHRTQLPRSMLSSIMDWKPGQPAADAVWWSLELDALAAAYGRRFLCLNGRRSLVQLGQIARRLLRQNGSTWAEFIMRATGSKSGGLQPARSSGWDCEDPLGILDRLAVTGGVAPVLLSA